MRKSLVDPKTGTVDSEQALRLDSELAELLKERGGVFSLEYVGLTDSWTAVWKCNTFVACRLGRYPVEAIDRLLTEVS